MTISSGSRKSGQKHQNSFAYVPSKHSPKVVAIAAMPTFGGKLLLLSVVCKRCYEIIEWKKKMSKYKPLTQPKTCANCKRKTVRDAYHVFCKDCASDKQVCGKCTLPNDLYIGEKESKINQKIQESRSLSSNIQIQESLNERQKRSFRRKIENGDEEGANRILQQALQKDFSDDDFSDDEFSEDS